MKLEIIVTDDNGQQQHHYFEDVTTGQKPLFDQWQQQNGRVVTHIRFTSNPHLTQPMYMRDTPAIVATTLKEEERITKELKDLQTQVVEACEKFLREHHPDVKVTAREATYHSEQELMDLRRQAALQYDSKEIKISHPNLDGMAVRDKDGALVGEVKNTRMDKDGIVMADIEVFDGYEPLCSQTYDLYQKNLEQMGYKPIHTLSTQEEIDELIDADVQPIIVEKRDD